MTLRALGVGIAAGVLGAVLAARAAGAPSSPPPPSSTPSGLVCRSPDQVVAVPPPSPLAVRYHRSGNVIWAAEQVVAVALPALLLFSGLSARLRSVARRAARGRFYPTLVLYLVMLSVALFVVELPLSYYVGYVREHAYGLSDQRLGKWFADQLKALAVGVAVGAATLWVPYLLLARSPRRWWLWTGTLSLPFFVLAALVAPIWIAPLFNKFGPMKDKALEAQVLTLAERAGVEGARVFQVEKSVDTKKVNAYVTGVGQTKRVVLWDTLLHRLTQKQTLFVVGHELGHYVLRHVWIGILVSTGLTMLGLWGAHRFADLLLARYSSRFGFDRLSDPASLPLLMLLLALFSFVTTPPSLALSRHYERVADRFGLELTGDCCAAATAFVALQEQNLAVPRPGWLYKVFRASHPPIGERVDFVNGYCARRRGTTWRQDELQPAEEPRDERKVPIPK
ncbi:MAG: M48 family metallopeptidase [Pseudomonadota bacterium]